MEKIFETFNSGDIQYLKKNREACWGEKRFENKYILYEGDNLISYRKRGDEYFSERNFDNYFSMYREDSLVDTLIDEPIKIKKCYNDKDNTIWGNKEESTIFRIYHLPELEGAYILDVWKINEINTTITLKYIKKNDLMLLL